ncbi:DUF4333 domain-containing protein [Streptomyces sp. NPDC054855]
MYAITRIAALAAIGALTLTACSVTTKSSSDSVGTEELEKQVANSLTEQVGQAPKTVDCPNKLEAKEGANTRCTLTAPDGTKYGLTVTADRKSSEEAVQIDIKVDQKPK